MQFKDLTPAQRTQLGLRQGVLVEKLAEGPARKAGLRAGDVIVALQGKPVSSATELRALIPKLPRNKAVPVLVRRGTAALFLALRVAE